MIRYEAVSELMSTVNQGGRMKGAKAVPLNFPLMAVGIHNLRNVSDINVSQIQNFGDEN